jgi:hypothetical protein
LKKTELETELEHYLNENRSIHSIDPRFTSFYNKRRSESSPVKRESSSLLSEVENTAKSVKRRVTNALQENFAST